VACDAIRFILAASFSSNVCAEVVPAAAVVDEVVLVAGGAVVAAEVLVAPGCVPEEAGVVGVAGGGPLSSAELTTLRIPTVIVGPYRFLSYSRTYPVASPGLRVTRETALA
jgi:hypothetical protein